MRFALVFSSKVTYYIGMNAEQTAAGEHTPSVEEQRTLLTTLQSEQYATLRSAHMRLRILRSLAQYDQDRLGLLGFGSSDLRMLVYYHMQDVAEKLQTVGVRVESVMTDTATGEPLRRVDVPIASTYHGLVMPYTMNPDQNYFKPEDCDVIYDMARELQTAQHDGRLPDLSADGTAIDVSRRPADSHGV